jgi:hypothetical protein
VRDSHIAHDSMLRPFGKPCRIVSGKACFALVELRMNGVLCEGLTNTLEVHRRFEDRESTLW